MRRRDERPVPPLDQAALEALALRYVERFATTRGKLADYLKRKIRERGWEGAPTDPAEIAARFAERGWIDDRGYADAKASSLARRGYGAGRVRVALQAARVESEDAAPAIERTRDEAEALALAFAQRRRIGPFAPAPADEKARARHLAIMVRAGHPFAIARVIVNSSAADLCE